jgi:hypothetical protein
MILACLVACTSNQTETPARSGRSCGHAHNDQKNERPLLGALELGFCSVEVDVHLAGDQLLVGHDPEDLSPEKTLEALYLEPLAAARRPMFLMIDVKTEAVPTWAAIEQRLARYDLSGVEVLISGNVAREEITGASPRRASIDGRVADLEAGVDAALFPLISDKWIDHFTWVGGVEAQPPDQKRKLAELVERAHAAGHKLRFWQTGDRTEIWRAQLEAGVDLIGTDDLAGLAALLKQ